MKQSHLLHEQQGNNFCRETNLIRIGRKKGSYETVKIKEGWKQTDVADSQKKKNKCCNNLE